MSVQHLRVNINILMHLLYREAFAKLEVYFKDLSFEHIEQQEGYAVSYSSYLTIGDK